MNLEELHTLDLCADGELRPDSDSLPGLFSLWVCVL